MKFRFSKTTGSPYILRGGKRIYGAPLRSIAKKAGVKVPKALKIKTKPKSKAASASKPKPKKTGLENKPLKFRRGITRYMLDERIGHQSILGLYFNMKDAKKMSQRTLYAKLTELDYAWSDEKNDWIQR